MLPCHNTFVGTEIRQDKQTLVNFQLIFEIYVLRSFPSYLAALLSNHSNVFRLFTV